MIDLKKVLMEVGNSLVTEHKFSPPGYRSVKSTDFIKRFTEAMNNCPEARALLKDHGLVWSVVKTIDVVE